jgi:hypothetical protein
MFSGLLLFNNPEKMATWGTQEEEKQNKNNPEKLATCYHVLWIAFVLFVFVLCTPGFQFFWIVFAIQRNW